MREAFFAWVLEVWKMLGWWNEIWEWGDDQRQRRTYSPGQGILESSSFSPGWKHKTEHRKEPLLFHFQYYLLHLNCQPPHAAILQTPATFFCTSWTFGTALALFLWSYLDFLAIPKIQLRDIPTTKVQLRSSKLSFCLRAFVLILWYTIT